jgi:hypothetical protein
VRPSLRRWFALWLLSAVPGPLACAACGVASPSSVPWSLLCPLPLLSRSLVLSRLGLLLRCCPSLLPRWRPLWLPLGGVLRLWRPLPLPPWRPSSLRGCRLGRGWCRPRPSWLLSGVWCRAARVLTLVGWWWWLVGSRSAACGLPWVAVTRWMLWPCWQLAVLPGLRVSRLRCGSLPVSRVVVAPTTSAVSRRNCLLSSFGRALRCATCWWHTRGCLNRRSSVHVSKEN